MSGLKDRDPRRDRAGESERARQPRRSRTGRIRASQVAAASASAAAATQQLPCQQPPWGQLTAVNVHTGEFAWRVPLGITEGLPADKQNTGRQATAARSRRRAAWCSSARPTTAASAPSTPGPARSCGRSSSRGAAQATPMTYEGRDGRQYVVIAATGGGFFNNPVTDDSLLAFAVPPAK